MGSLYPMSLESMMIPTEHIKKPGDTKLCSQRLTKAMHTYKDKLTVHNIILHNIAEGSDAFTYAKPYLKKDDGKLYNQALVGQYENASIQEQYINKAKRTLEKLTYRIERALKFKKFVAKFIKACD